MHLFFQKITFEGVNALITVVSCKYFFRYIFLSFCLSSSNAVIQAGSGVNIDGATGALHGGPDTVRGPWSKKKRTSKCVGCALWWRP